MVDKFYGLPPIYKQRNLILSVQPNDNCRCLRGKLDTLDAFLVHRLRERDEADNNAARRIASNPMPKGDISI
jgi:hypothetical protein